MDCENLGLAVSIPQSVPAAVLDRAEAPEQDQPGSVSTCETAIAPRQSSQLSPEFDLRLAVLAAIRQPNETLSTEDIAAFCGCCRQTIVNIEERALKKLRKALRKSGVNPEDIHFTEHSFANRADRAIHE